MSADDEVYAESRDGGTIVRLPRKSTLTNTAFGTFDVVQGQPEQLNPGQAVKLETYGGPDVEFTNTDLRFENVTRARRAIWNKIITHTQHAYGVRLVDIFDKK